MQDHVVQLQMVKVFEPRSRSFNPGFNLGVQFGASLDLFQVSCLGSVKCPQLLLHCILLDLEEKTLILLGGRSVREDYLDQIR